MAPKQIGTGDGLRLIKQTVVAVFGLVAIWFGAMASFVLIPVAVLFMGIGIFLFVALRYIR
jgi:hypothetical protein